MRFAWKYFVLGLVLSLFPSALLFSRQQKPEVLSVTVTVPTSTPTPPAEQDLALPDTPTLTPTPKNTPTPKPTPVSSSEINGFIERYAREYSVDANALRHIAVCESGFNPNAKNGPYVGLYQFTTNTWSNNRKIMNEDPNPDLRTNAIYMVICLISTLNLQFIVHG